MSTDRGEPVTPEELRLAATSTVADPLYPQALILLALAELMDRVQQIQDRL